MSHDQPDTARLIERLGIGLQVPWKRRQRDLGRALDTLLEDDSLAHAARRLAEDLNSRDGAALAADAVESLLDEDRQLGVSG